MDNALCLIVLGTTLVVGSPFGLYKSNDNSTTWVDISAGAGASNLYAQTLATSANNIFVGTAFKTVGVWKRPLSEVGTVTGIINVAAQQALAVSPHPSADGVFNVVLNNASNANIAVTNLLGEVVYTERAAGNNQVLNLGHLATGMYLLQVQDGKTLSAQKITIQK